MKRRHLTYRNWLFGALVAGGGLAFGIGCGQKKGEAPESAVEPDTVTLSAAKALTERGYDLKKEGRNRDALVAFEQAAEKIAAGGGAKSEAYASSLDDQATIFLRTGDSKKAKQLYGAASDLLRAVGKTETRLFAGIQRRLKTIDALAEAGVVCAEPMTPEVETTSDGYEGEDTASDGTDTASDGEDTASDGMDTSSDTAGGTDGGRAADALPYFPDKALLQQAFGKFNLALKGCLDDSAGALPVWTVVTGDGRIVLASVKSETLDPTARSCIEKGLLRVSAENRAIMPRFSACYRNFTYPLAFRK